MLDLVMYLALTVIMGNEGYKPVAYTDRNGIAIGYGHHLTARYGDAPDGCAEYSCLYWTKEVAFNQLVRDVRDVRTQLSVRHNCFDDLPINGQVVMLDMGYNLGVDGLLEFRKLELSVCENKWGAAANHILDSEYAEQVPNRARRNANTIRGLSHE